MKRQRSRRRRRFGSIRQRASIDLQSAGAHVVSPRKTLLRLVQTRLTATDDRRTSARVTCNINDADVMRTVHSAPQTAVEFVCHSRRIHEPRSLFTIAATRYNPDKELARN